MQIKVKTDLFQSMVSRAVKGASCNRMIPITGLMSIELENNKLTLTTTDMSNYLEIMDNHVEGDNFSIVVPVEVFSKLISKMTTDTITLTLTDATLQVKGNGTYTIQLPLDEEGELITFPKYKFDANQPKHVINLSDIESILKVNKAAVAETLEIPCYSAYYLGDSAVTTDTFKICINNIKLFEAPVLIPSELMELLGIMKDDAITVQQDGAKMLFTSSNCNVFGTQREGIEDFNIDTIIGFAAQEFESKCKLPKKELMNVLNRLMLFVTPYDMDGVYLTFNNEGVLVSSKQSTGVELIRYQGSDSFKPFTCCADISLLYKQISAIEGELIELYYGSEDAIKIVSKNVTQIVALLEDDRAQ